MAAPLSPNDLTRQQLDELDTLLQRMLALPLNKPDLPNAATGAPPPPLPEMPPINGMWRSDAAAPTIKAPFLNSAVPESAMTLSAAVTPSGLVRPGPSAFAVVPTLQPAPTATPSTGTLRGVDAPALPATFTPPPPSWAPLEPMASEPVTPRVPLLHWPLFAANSFIEGILGLFGPLGTIASKTPVKMAMGCTGMALIAGAAAWSAFSLGWVSWPQ